MCPDTPTTGPSRSRWSAPDNAVTGDSIATVDADKAQASAALNATSLP